MTDEGILLRQHHYTQDCLRERCSHIPVCKRTTSGEPEHFRRETPLPPDPSNSEHQEWAKIGQKILGGSLWLSTRARPDLSYSVSSAAQVLTKEIELLKVKLRHFYKTSTPLKLVDSFTHTLGIER